MNPAAPKVDCNVAVIGTGPYGLAFEVPGAGYRPDSETIRCGAVLKIVAMWKKLT